MLAATSGSNTERYLHGSRGIHAAHNGTDWRYTMQDGIGSVRGWVNSSGSVSGIVNYTPYGVPDAPVDEFGFTGEQTNGNGLLYLRARHYNPNIATMTALDPWEGNVGRPMSLNGYTWVMSNVPNMTDPTGMFGQLGGLVLFDNPLSIANSLNGGICLSQSSHISDCIDKCRQQRSDGGITPRGRDVCQSRCERLGDECQDLLDDAYELYKNGGQWAQKAVEILDENFRDSSGNWRCASSTPMKHLEAFSGGLITFDNPFTGSTAPFGNRILMDSGMLDAYQSGNVSNFTWYTGVLAQELWHTQQPRMDRLSVWGELEAYNYELRVRQEIGAGNILPEQDRQTILNLGLPGEIPKDIRILCHARHALPDFWLYEQEPLFWVGGVFPIDQWSACSNRSIDQ